MTIFDVMDCGGLRIPKIQRDYVMGRPEEDTRNKAKKSIMKIFQAVFCGIPDPMYFVYGIQNEKSRLMLLDGQQRLTTLVIAAWYLGYDTKDWIVEYEARRWAQYFFDKLLRTRCSDREKPWEALSSQPWFLPDFLSDATVQSVKCVLEIMAEEFGERYKGLMVPNENLKESLSRITFTVEDMRIVNASADSFNETFLKMNARGLPLTSWEKMKAVMDGYCQKVESEADKEIVEKWECKIDGDWPEKLWSLVDNDIKQLDQAMESIVKMAVVYCSFDADTAAKNHLRLDFSLDDLNVHLGGKVAQLICILNIGTRFFERVADSKSYLRQDWSAERNENALWRESSEPLSEDAFKAMLRGRPTILSFLRFVLLCSDEWEGASTHDRRVALNIIDALDSSDVSYDNVFKILREVESYLALDAKKSSGLERLQTYFRQKEESSRVRRQVDEESYKWALHDEESIKELECNQIVNKSCIRFLRWGNATVTAKDLLERAYGLEKLIKDGWTGFYCDLLSWIERNSQNENWLPETWIAVPSHTENWKVWREQIFYDEVFIQALSRYENGGKIRNVADMPAWMTQLIGLLESGTCLHNWLRYYGDWVYYLRGNRKGSIRLDRNEVEAFNRLFVGRKYINYVSAVDRDKPLKISRNDKDLFYDVWNESWWTTKLG